jgi:isopentenyl-diphosphate delta-isomerase
MRKFLKSDNMCHMTDEIVDLVDAQNISIRPISKHEAHIHGWLHRTILAEALDSSGNIILVRQAADRQDAGQYVCPVGGHIRSGETNLQALRREAKEEIGIDTFSYHYFNRFIYERHVIGRHENHFFIIYQIIIDPSQIILGPESTHYRVFTPIELKQALHDTPKEFGASYFVLLEKYFPELLYHEAITRTN